MDVMPAPAKLFDATLPPGAGFSKTKVIGSLLGAFTVVPAQRLAALCCRNQFRRWKLCPRHTEAAASRQPGLEERVMTLLKWALIFFVVSVIAGVLGFTGISAASADVARFLFYVFVVIFLVLLVLGLTIFKV
jgi:uncharacterized membrane protein YtjA (UPF0391 family)